MSEEARRDGWGLLTLATASGSLLALGAFSLLLYTDDDELTRFWLRLTLGIALAIWALVKFLTETFHGRVS